MKRLIGFIKKLVGFLLTKGIVIILVGYFAYQVIAESFNSNPNFDDTILGFLSNWQMGLIFAGAAVVGYFFSGILVWRIPNKQYAIGRVCDTIYVESFAKRPVIEFFVNGVRYEFEGTRLGEFIKSGNLRKVAYNKLNPAQAAEVSPPSDYRFLLYILIFGLSCILLDLIF